MAYATLLPSKHKPYTPHVRLVMTKEEHRDLVVGLQLACTQLHGTKVVAEKAYLDRLRKLYDFVFKLEDMTK